MSAQSSQQLPYEVPCTTRRATIATILLCLCTARNGRNQHRVGGTEVEIQDVRQLPQPLRLEVEGASVLASSSAVHSFYDEDELRRVGYSETAELVRSATAPRKWWCSITTSEAAQAQQRRWPWVMSSARCSTSTPTSATRLRSPGLAAFW